MRNKNFFIRIDVLYLQVLIFISTIIFDRSVELMKLASIYKQLFLNLFNKK